MRQNIFLLSHLIGGGPRRRPVGSEWGVYEVSEVGFYIEKLAGADSISGDDSLYPAYYEKYDIGERDNRFEVEGGHWHFVGMGVARDTCGHIMPDGVGMCACGVETRIRRFRCNKPGCPICAWSEQKKTGDRISERLRAYQSLLKYDTSGLGSINYFVFSPPDAAGRITTKAGITALRKELYQVMSYAGLQGGVWVLHPWRITDYGWELYEMSRSALGTHERAIWDWLRDRDLLNEVDGCVYFSPHYHVWGSGWVMESKKFEAGTGWVYKKLGGNLSRDDLDARIAYVLTHRGVWLDNDGGTIRQEYPFGCVSYHRMARSRTTDKIYGECEECGTGINVVSDYDEIPDDAGQYYPCGHLDYAGDWVGCDRTDEPYHEYLIETVYWMRAFPSWTVAFTRETVSRY